MLLTYTLIIPSGINKMNISCFKKYLPLLLLLLSSCFLPGEKTIIVNVYNKTYEPITVHPTQNVKGYTKVGIDQTEPVLVNKDEEIEAAGDDSGNIKRKIFNKADETWKVSW